MNRIASLYCSYLRGELPLSILKDILIENDLEVSPAFENQCIDLCISPIYKKLRKMGLVAFTKELKGWSKAELAYLVTLWKRSNTFKNRFKKGILGYLYTYSIYGLYPFDRYEREIARQKPAIMEVFDILNLKHLKSMWN